MVEFSVLVVMGTLVMKIMDFIKYLRAKDWNAVVTQAGAWVAGVVVVMLVAATDFASLLVNNIQLGNLNIASQILLGLVLTSLISTAYDFKKAIDNNDTAKTPSLLSGKYESEMGPASTVVVQNFSEPEGRMFVDGDQVEDFGHTP